MQASERQNECKFEKRKHKNENLHKEELDSLKMAHSKEIES
jgi:hypothetical protein